MDDFQFASFKVQTGNNWLEIYGTLKKTQGQTLFLKIEWRKCSNPAQAMSDFD